MFCSLERKCLIFGAFWVDWNFPFRFLVDEMKSKKRREHLCVNAFALFDHSERIFNETSLLIEYKIWKDTESFSRKNLGFLRNKRVTVILLFFVLSILFLAFMIQVPRDSLSLQGRMLAEMHVGTTVFTTQLQDYSFRAISQWFRTKAHMDSLGNLLVVCYRVN